MSAQTVYREILPGHLPRFVERGYRPRWCFLHKTFAIPKCGPNAIHYSTRMLGKNVAEAYWVRTLHATGDVLRRFPQELFFDDDLVWHRQQFGQPGHIAYAVFVTAGNSLYGLNYVSDIVERQTRAQEYRTQIQSRFDGWSRMLLNALMCFAIEHSIDKIWSATADLAMRYSDPHRTVQPELFECIYDRTVVDLFAAQRVGDWWTVDVEENRQRAVLPEERTDTQPSGKVICITHDIERGLGHVETDMEFAQRIHRTSEQHLDRMLAEERRAGVRATYNVVGCIYDDVREKIAADGHCLAFHSYDHLRYDDASRKRRADSLNEDTILMPANMIRPSDSAPGGQQLPRCRSVDYRTRGYRVPNSRMTEELIPRRLLWRNFDWLASSESSIETTTPVLRDNIVYIPIMFDDFPLHKQQMDYQKWENWALECIRQNDFVAFGLHDCYGAYWLDRYADFLEKVAALGTLRTCDQVADDVVLAHCV